MSNNNSQSTSKRGPPQIFGASSLQVPHMAKIAQSVTAESSKKSADSGLPSGAISRAQLKEPVSLPLPYSNGALASSHRSHTAEMARAPQSSDVGGGVKRAPPSSWDEALTTFLSRFCSPHQFGLESMAVWHDDMAKLATPSGQTRQVWRLCVAVDDGWSLAQG
ncbi:hypothetical protein IWW57_001510 [Coemansia sp. S610]|nr:hypothetical protein IWW57_001510 [Coemansia sp. S610]